MVEGAVKKIAMDFDVESVATSAKASKDLKVAQVGADIEAVIKHGWFSGSGNYYNSIYSNV